MTTITAETSVRDIAVQAPTTIPVFEKLKIDYCCHGQHTLAEACSKANVEVDAVLNQLEQQATSQQGGADAWQTANLSALVDHIIQKHHAFTRQQLALIGDLSAKVERRHGATHPEIAPLNKAIADMGTELTSHAGCEEAMLFPYIKELEEKGDATPAPVFGTVKHPISHMTADHDKTGTELEKIRKMTNSYQPPADACPTFQAFYRALKDLEDDLHQHIHLENNILFPRAMVLAHERP
jgi:regulator of cell morphogenesis and NO signaling